jgi:acetyl-CoA C-acetyltransferase
MALKDKVAIIGVGSTRFGENFEQSYFDMVTEASYEAFKDAGVTNKDIQAAWLGTVYPRAYGFEGDGGTSLAEPLNMYGIPITRVANFCATGMDAVRNAAIAVAAGEYDLVMAVGVEKMRDVPPRGSLVSQHVEAGHPVLCKGRTAPGMFALCATRYFEEYGIDRTPLAKVAVKNHYNGSLNPKAHFRNKITEEAVFKAPMMAEPLGLFDCCPTTDGAAAVILASIDVAERLKADYVPIMGMGLSVGSGYFNAQFRDEFDFLGFPATQKAAQQAYAQAGITDPLKQIDVAECHDCFTITEIINYEDLGFAPRGEGWRFITEGESTLEGQLPVNTSGGLKACGHPIGATGARMVGEIVDQVRGRAGDRQVKGARTALCHTLGGPQAVGCVIVVGR